MQHENKKVFDREEIKLKAPFNLLISGSSRSGKSTNCFKLIYHRNEIIDKQFTKIFYCLPENHEIFIPQVIKNDKAFSVVNQIPSVEILKSIPGHKLVILDDMMTQLDEEILNLFTRHGHHLSVSLCILVQTLFFNANKYFRSVSLQCNLFLICKNPRNSQHISILASQISPGNIKYIQEAYADATKKPYGYLFFDFSQHIDDNLRIRTNIFPSEHPQNIIYISMK
jgi:hypothetical protein